MLKTNLEELSAAADEALAQWANARFDAAQHESNCTHLRICVEYNKGRGCYVPPEESCDCAVAAVASAPVPRLAEIVKQLVREVKRLRIITANEGKALRFALGDDGAARVERAVAIETAAVVERNAALAQAKTMTELLREVVAYGLAERDSRLPISSCDFTQGCTDPTCEQCYSKTPSLYERIYSTLSGIVAPSGGKP